MMTQQQIRRKQWKIALFIALGLLVLGAGRLYTFTFRASVHLGPLTKAVLIVDEPVGVWEDPASLAEIQAALPRLGMGSGYQITGHSHEAFVLLLWDGGTKETAFMLPSTDDDLVSARAQPPRVTMDNSWRMPRLLGVMGRLTLEDLARRKVDSPARQHLEHWRDTYGGGAAAPSGGQD